MSDVIVVTGAGGFIGRQTIDPLIAAGFLVHAVSRRAPVAPPRAGVTWHEVNLLDRGAARGLLERIRPSHLLHLAWNVEHGTFWHSADNLRWVAASLGLALDFVDLGGRRMVVAGTYAEYEWLQGGVCVAGVTPEQPATLYGESKLRLQQLLSRLFRDRGAELAWGRIFNPYGEHEDERRFIPYVVRSLLRGERARCTSGQQRRDYLHVADLGDAFCAMSRADSTGIFNLCSGVGVALSDVAALIGRQLGRAELIGLGDVPTPPGTAPFIVGDVSRLGAELKWSPKIDLRDGIARTVDFWRART